jgi:hypothetical protein
LIDDRFSFFLNMIAEFQVGSRNVMKLDRQLKVVIQALYGFIWTCCWKLMKPGRIDASFFIAVGQLLGLAHFPVVSGGSR